MNCYFKKYALKFKQPGGTSRGVLYEKETYFIFLQNEEKTAIGECNRFTKLSYDDRPNYEAKLAEICSRLPDEMEAVLQELTEWPSIFFGIEMLLKDWGNGGNRIIFPEAINENGFTIPTNGLIWMGSKESMLQQIKLKLDANYKSIKLKIGAIDFDTELELLQYIRKQFSVDEVEIRLDANGAFIYQEAKEKIKQLSDFGISYIEQPINTGQWQDMAALCNNSPIKIALDEELIGIQNSSKRKALIDTIQPQILILKHALIGGFYAADEWKKLIENNGGTWVITSALESNIGLNAIAQYTALKCSDYAQGLGTGQLFTNNFPAPYSIDANGLHYHKNQKWDLSALI
ncbi:MAG TPA: o-succinylbenzoate synthase [Chitinophagales bacterium]|nr:o-succinylbenzoate synthase [Chitinophagales bacterium]HMZ69641.1 o-succinylbenzoate synthase [Chitinophagales bacterium]HNI02795.1 o-succinylbenzoate synthase [Chitinophagales bacterium]HNM67512.1 o-succinylbenzoate synthase [Chitinophagales bacterium]HNO49174.1 o-succinylbenzoate synthase [Chitinophagales bacterium]